MDNLFVGIIAACACLGLGAQSLRLFRLSPSHAFEEIALSGALGFGLMAFIVFIVGSFKLLHPVFFVIAVVSVFLLTLRSLKSMLSQAVKHTIQGFVGSPVYFKFALILAAVVAVFSLCGVLAPPTGQDELCYHLTQPKNYLRAHAIYEVPFSTNSLWPYLGEMLFTLGLLLKGPETAKFFHFCYYLLTILFVYNCALRLFGNKAARWAALFYALMPAAYIQASYAYIDHVLACYFIAAFYCADEFFEGKGVGWAALSGVFCGLCLSAKLIGLFSLPAIAAAASFRIISGRNTKDLFRAGLLFGLGVLLFGSLFYLRSWMLRGNPVFPFYPQFFGGHGWLDATYVDAHGRGKGLLDFLLLWWDTSVHPQWFGGEHVGVCFLAMLPLFFLSVKQEKRSLSAWIYFLLLTVFWFLVDQNIRFWFGGLAMAAVFSGAAAAAVLDLPGKVFRGAVQAVILFFLTIQTGIAAYHFRDEALLVFRGSKEDYLRSHERTYPVARMVNRMLHPDDVILSFGEIRGYYFDNRMVLESDFNQVTHYRQQNLPLLSLRNFFRDRGLTHLLVLDGSEPVFLAQPETEAFYFKSKAVVHFGGLRYVLYQIV